MTAKLRVEIVSDFVCPWCYVGKKRFEKAQELAPEVDVEFAWSPFQLSPDMPREGRRRVDHYQEIFGEQRASQIMASMRDTGIEEGIAFGSDPEAMSPNTLSAHTLLLWAIEDTAIDADAVAEALFHAHHVDCSDIGSHDVLVRIAEAAGMDGEQVRARLTEGVDEERVQQAIADAAGRGVSGVPFFVVADKYGISGAQPPEVLADALRQIAGENAA